MKKQSQRKERPVQIINYKYPKIVVSNLKTEHDFKQFAQRLSEVLSVLTN